MCKVSPFLFSFQGDVEGRYESIDKESPIAIDRQVVYCTNCAHSVLSLVNYGQKLFVVGFGAVLIVCVSFWRLVSNCRFEWVNWAVICSAKVIDYSRLLIDCCDKQIITTSSRCAWELQWMQRKFIVWLQLVPRVEIVSCDSAMLFTVLRDHADSGTLPSAFLN
jgi:hypothetical protein